MLWILLYKTEGQKVCLKNVGGTTEVLGALIYPLRKAPDDSAIFVNQDGRLSISFSQNGAPRYPVVVREIRDGKTTELTPKDVKGRSVGLYVSAP